MPEDDGEENAVDDGDDNAGNDDDNDEIDNEEEEEISSVVEKTFKFEDFAKRLINPKVVRSCTLVLQDWEHISTKSLKSAVTILYRIAYELKCVGMLFQAVLFRVFQEVLRVERDGHNDELRRLGVFVVRKFVEIAPNNPKIFAELLFYKTIKDANDLETGYCDSYDSGTKVSWTEEQEEELRHLFLENQNNPQTDQDVIDWIIDNLIDKSRTRRAVLRKLREMGLEFKLPTKKSHAAARKGWLQEEDELLTDLYYEHRLNDECLKKLEEGFVEKYNKNQIIKRMLQLHLIADRSEIVPKKKGRASKKKGSNQQEEEGEFNEEEGSAVPRKPKKSSKPKKRTINKSPIDVPAVQSLISQLKEDFEEAITWLQESLQDASEDVDQTEDEEDGVPLVALGSAEKDAMESTEFHKLLLAMGMQPPLDGMESYWRIPVHLKSGDLTMRAKILAGEDVDMEENGNESSEEEQEGSEEEEDYLDAHINKRKQQMDNLVFNNSDNEDDNDKWEALKNSIKSKSKAQKQSKKSKENKRKDFGSNDGDSNDGGDIENDNEDIINVNSEQLRERLAELSDSENESDNESNQTIIEASNKTVARRRNVIESDDDGEDDAKKDDTDKDTETEEDQTDHQHSMKSDGGSGDGDDGGIEYSKTRKRSRLEVDDEDKEQSGSDDAGNGEDMFLKRKKTETEITKRRRIAVIDDDDDDE